MHDCDTFVEETKRQILISCYTRKSITTVLQFKFRLLISYISGDL